MSQDDDFKQAMHGWLNSMAAQQDQPTQPVNQVSPADTQQHFQSLGTTDLEKSVQPDHPGSLGVQFMNDSRSTLGVTHHTFSANDQSIKLTENHVSPDMHQEKKQD